MMGAPTILAFNLSAAAIKVLEAVCAAMDMQCSVVERAEFAVPLGRHIGIPVNPPVSPAQHGAFGEPMLLMCNLDEALFNAFLQALRYSGFPKGVLKAVLTPTNATWTACQLYGELCRERDAMRRGR